MQYDNVMKIANRLIVERGEVSVTQDVPRRGLQTIAAYILPETRERIQHLQSQQQTKGDRRSDSWFVDQALREYIVNEGRDTSFEQCTGDDQILGYVSKETKKWVKNFARINGRSESWVTSKAITVFLRQCDIEEESDRGS
jgi:hypothetical protein